MEKIYPTLSINRNTKANKFYAVPIIGILVKIIACIPIYIELFFLGIAGLVVITLNSLNVLFRGNYWSSGYQYLMGLLRLTTKLSFYIWGLTDSYPGFDFKTNGLTLEMAYPKTPNRWFAFPLLGGVVRLILLIPYLIYSQVLSYGAGAGVLASFFKVLVEASFPESTYEFAKDSKRVSLASGCYMIGLSDSYPSFKISMNHRNIKIALIIIGVLGILLRFIHPNPSTYHPYQQTHPTYSNP